MKHARDMMLVLLVVLAATGLAFAKGAQETVDSEKVTLNVLNYIEATSPGYAEYQAVWQAFMDQNLDIL